MLYIIYFDPYRVRKATKNDLESSNAFRFVHHLAEAAATTATKATAAPASGRGLKPRRV